MSQHKSPDFPRSFSVNCFPLSFLSPPSLNAHLGIPTPLSNLTAALTCHILHITLFTHHRFGGYAGDLSPGEVYSLLEGEAPALLLDVRPDAVRAKEGVAELKLGARCGGVPPFCVFVFLRVFWGGLLCGLLGGCMGLLAWSGSVPGCAAITWVLVKVLDAWYGILVLEATALEV